MPVSPPPPFDEAPWKDVTLPAEALRVQTMLSEEEGQMLYWLARDYATGAGAICDLGCFAGGSTARMAAGAAEGGHGAEIHAFDHFTIQEGQKERYMEPAGIPYFRGNDMLPAVQELLSPWSDRMHYHKGDIRETGWSGGPIEILFVDASKTPETADIIASRFMPHLIPGRSLVIQQDYQHWRQPWVPAQMELLTPCFELVAWCHKGTAVFRCTAEVGGPEIAAAQTRALSDAQMTTLIRQAMTRFPHKAQRKRLACAILAVADNPGLRLSYRFENHGFSADRVQAELELI